MKKKVMVAGIISILITIILFLPQKTMAKETEPDTSDIDIKIEQYIEKNNLNDSAVTVSVMNTNEVLYERNFGYADKKRNIIADENTIYEWGSLSKTLTWISVMQLMEQGKIDLHEDINTYLPDHYLKKIKYTKPVTMLDLMNHTGGWQDSITNIYTDDINDILPLEEYVSRYEPIQLYEPGTTVAYSNWSTTLAGYIVERVSGQDYCDYVTSHILVPLQMDHTSIYPLHDDNEFVKRGLEKVTGYTTKGKEIQGDYYAPDYPAAGAVSTMKDVQQLIKVLLSKDGIPLFKNPDTLKTMLEPTYYFAGAQKPENAHGLWYDSYFTPSLGHYGNTPQFSVHMSIAPTANLGMIIMTNQAQEMALNHGLGEIVYGETNDATKQKYKPLILEKYYTSARTIEYGYCRFYHYFQTFKVKEVDDNKIIISSPLFMKISCTRVGENVYVATNGSLKGYHFYTDNNNGSVQKIATSTFDMIPYSTGIILLDNISFILMVIAYVTTFILLLLCIKNFYKKRTLQNSISLSMNVLSTLVVVGIIVQFANFITTAASTNDMIPYIIYYNIYLIASIGFAVYLILGKQKSVLNKLTLSTSIIIMCFILYWQMVWIC